MLKNVLNQVNIQALVIFTNIFQANLSLAGRPLAQYVERHW